MFATIKDPLPSDAFPLSREDQQIFGAARTAISSLAKTFELWMVVARAVERAYQMAEQKNRRDAFERILEREGIAKALGNTWASQKSTANKLRTILARLPQVEAWRATLSENERLRWSAPTTIYKHCSLLNGGAVTDDEEDEGGDKPTFDRPERDPLKPSPEDQIAALTQRLAELEFENLTLRGEIQSLLNTIKNLTAEIDQLKGKRKARA
jgi:hypothetical protein